MSIFCCEIFLIFVKKFALFSLPIHCDVVAESRNSGARKGGCCYSTAGAHPPASTNKQDIARQQPAYTSQNNRDAGGWICCVIRAEAIHITRTNEEEGIRTSISRWDPKRRKSVLVRPAAIY